MRKPRSDSRLAALTPAMRDELADKLLDGMSYADAKDWLHMDCNVETSEAALGGFYRHFCAPLRLRRAAEAADALPELAGGMMANWDEASVSLVKQRYFELLAQPWADPKDLAVFAMQIGDINRGRLEREKLRFQRQKTAATLRLKRRDQALSQAKFEEVRRRNAEAREKLNQVVQTKGGLTPETISQIEEALKLL